MPEADASGTLSGPATLRRMIGEPTRSTLFRRCPGLRRLLPMLALLIAVVVGAAKAEPARRVISLAPSLTAILVALDRVGRHQILVHDHENPQALHIALCW